MSESNNVGRVSRSGKLVFQMSKFDNFSKWFDDVLFKGGVLDNRYPVKGFAVYMGWGTRIINKVTGLLEERLGKENYFKAKHGGKNRPLEGKH